MGILSGFFKSRVMCAYLIRGCDESSLSAKMLVNLKMRFWCQKSGESRKKHAL